jgi:hypothetical protein
MLTVPVRRAAAESGHGALTCSLLGWPMTAARILAALVGVCAARRADQPRQQWYTARSPARAKEGRHT